LLENFVAGNQRQLFFDGLRDQQPVEGVAMVSGKGNAARNVTEPEVERGEPVYRHLFGNLAFKAGGEF